MIRAVITIVIFLIPFKTKNKLLLYQNISTLTFKLLYNCTDLFAFIKLKLLTLNFIQITCKFKYAIFLIVLLHRIVMMQPNNIGPTNL